MGLEEVRSKYFRRYPDAERLDAALQSPANINPIFFINEVRKQPDIKGTCLALLRLGENLERRFGINGEVAAYFVPWRDFQRRSFNAITEHTNDIVRSSQLDALQSVRFTPSRRLALLISKDPGIQLKLDEWQRDSSSELTVVAIDPNKLGYQDALVEISENLKKRFGERDLYRTQNPVSGFDFFGRENLLLDLKAAIEGDQNVAILGLRRSGKTSVLQELRRRLLARRVIMPIVDFQMLDTKSVEDLVVSIAERLNDELKSAKEKNISLWVGNETEQASGNITPATLSDRIKRVASRNPGIRIAIAVDEVESAAKIANTDPMAIKVLLGALRSAAQSSDNVSLIFSGVANRMFRSSSLGESYEIDNPMFNQVDCKYLTPFEREDTSTLLRKLGRPMQLDWQSDAIDRVHALTGGFPYFVRDLASAIRQNLQSETDTTSVDTIRVTSENVSDVSTAWFLQAGEAWKGIIEALGLHYPSAADLLDPSLSEDELTDWVQGDPSAEQASEDLIALGLLEHSETGLCYAEALSALQPLVRKFPNQRTRPDQFISANDLTALIGQGESHSLEFKETSRIDVKTGQKAKFIEDSIVKAVAGFLNSDGGTLLVGVSDAGAIKGIDADLDIFAGSLDRFERWLHGDLLRKRIDSHLITDYVKTEFPIYRGKRVLKVVVSPSKTPAWVDDNHLYRRTGNQTIELKSGREITQFIAGRG